MNRDTHEFGFTLATASPVSIPSTTKNGSTARAGTIAGDKIIKVCMYLFSCKFTVKVLYCISSAIITGVQINL